MTRGPERERLPVGDRLTDLLVLVDLMPDDEFAELLRRIREDPDPFS